MERESSATPTILGIKVFSNEGLGLLRATLKEIEPLVTVAAISSVFKVKSESQSPRHVHELRSRAIFDGLVVSLRGFSELSAEELVGSLQRIAIGLRSDSLRRSVSIYLYFYGTEALMTPELTLPYPDFHLRPEFVLPAAEISPDYVHPVLKVTLRELGRRFSGVPWGEFVTQGKAVLDF